MTAGEELALARAAGRGDAEALAVLERDYFSTLPAALRRFCNGGASVDEVLQAMRTELLMPRASGTPGILTYSGRGELRAWLRSVAVRMAMRMNRLAPPLPAEAHAPEAGGDVELGFMKKTYGESFQRAFRTALAALPEHQRLLLKQRFRHGLGVEELGAIHGVNPGTISRRVAEAREELVAATRKAMMAELGVNKADVDSILRLIHSQVDLNLSTRDAG